MEAPKTSSDACCSPQRRVRVANGAAEAADDVATAAGSVAIGGRLAVTEGPAGIGVTHSAAGQLLRHGQYMNRA